MTSFKNFYNKYFRWDGLLLLSILLFFAIWSKIQDNNLNKNPVYTHGISLGLKSGARGTLYLHYNFITNTGYHESSISSTFYKKCDACLIIGDTAIVEYEKDNPDNNNLLLKLPQGAKFDDNP